MERSKSQILYNFLKEDTFDYEQTGIIGKVNNIRPAYGSDKLPRSYITERIRPRLDKWESAPNFNVDTSIVKPQSVEFEVFPRTFECSRCNALSSFTRKEFKQFRKGSSSSLTCGNRGCDRELSARDQMQLVNVCKCGRIDSLFVPENGQYRLQRSTRGLASSKLVSLDGSGDERPLSYYMGECFDCQRPPSEQDIKVHSASSCFYPQRATFVNIEQEEIDLIQNNSRYREKVILDYISEEVESEPQSASEALENKLDDLLEKLDDETSRKVEAADEELHNEEKEQREEAKQFIEERFNDDQRTAISEELFELERLQSQGDVGDEVYAHSLDDLHSRAGPASIYDPEKVESFIDLRKEIGVSEVRLMENFPVTTAVYGYSRINHEPVEGTELNAFSGERGSEIYAQTAQAEAVQFTLDLATVYSWLDSHSFIHVSSDIDTSDEYALRRWFIEQLSTETDAVLPFFEDTGREPTVKHAVLTLLHSYSHVMINAIDTLSGYSRESLVEYLLPRPLSFVIYKRSDTDFNLGAIFTLIEDRFNELIEQTRSESRDCMYDPICEQEDGHACEGCLYVSNLSCDYGNNTLSRAVLFGGEYDGREFNSYLNHARSVGE